MIELFISKGASNWNSCLGMASETNNASLVAFYIDKVILFFYALKNFIHNKKTAEIDWGEQFHQLLVNRMTKYSTFNIYENSFTNIWHFSLF